MGEVDRRSNNSGKLNGRDWVILGCFFVICLSAGTSEVLLLGDSASYTMMTDSLARDGDLVLGAEDLERVETEPYHLPPKGLILRASGEDFLFAKPVLYPLLSTPLYMLFGKQALLLVNGLLGFGILAMGYIHARRFAEPLQAAALVSAVVFLSVTWFYMFVAMADMLLFFLVALAYFLAARRHGLLAMIPLALLVSEKAPNLLIALPLLVLPLLEGRWKESLRRTVVLAAALMVVIGLTWWLTGVPSAYMGERYSVARPELDASGKITGKMKPIKRHFPVFFENLSHPDAGLLAANLGWVLIGRHAGILVYYLPLIALLILPGNWKMRLALICCGLLFFVTLLLLGPTHWQGGRTIGFRYFYIYPAFLFAVQGLERWKRILPVLALAALFTVPITANPLHYAGTVQAYSSDYTNLGPWRWLPYEHSLSEHLPHRMRFKPKASSTLMAYSDDPDVYPAGGDGFWLRGNSEGNFTLITNGPLVGFALRNGVATGTADVIHENKVVRLRFERAWRMKEVHFDDPKPFFKADGREWYRITVRCNFGFRPSETLGTKDRRLLGAAVLFK